MGRYATYRAVRDELVTAALADEEPGPALGELVVDEDADGPSADLTNTFDALAWVLAGPDGDHTDLDDPLVAAVRGYREVAPDSPTVNDPARVAGIARALAGFDPARIRPRFDTPAMEAEHLEPGGFDDPAWPDVVTESFGTLRELYLDAASRGLAVLVDIG